jgi:hypothetical protein
MNRASVDEYFAHISQALAPGGLFYSLNAHGKAGIRRPSDYRVDLFDLVSFRPLRRAPFFVFATEPYELVLGRHSTTQNEIPLVSEWLDALGGLVQLGFHDEILDLCVALPKAEPRRDELLQPLHDFVWSADPDEKLEAVESLRSLASPIPCDYLEGTVRFAQSAWEAAASLLEVGLEAMPKTHARTRGLLMKACAEHATGDLRTAALSTQAAVEAAPHLADEIEATAVTPHSCAQKVAAQIGLVSPPFLASTPRKRSKTRP